jgi:predicted N-acetyltransferase YhbS
MASKSPDPIPIILLGRLAVDREYAGGGIGSDLLRDALVRGFAVFNTVGAKAVITHALTQSARDFYMRHGFSESPQDPMSLMVSMKQIAEYFGS